MAIVSGDNGGENDKPEHDGHPEDEEATRILPARTSEPVTPGTVIGTADSDGGDEEKTFFMPVAGSGGDAVREPESSFNPAVGWLVILEGPGRGQHCPVYYGQNSIGRGEDQRIRLNFGDARITRDTHAYLVYDDIARKFYLRDNGKANLIRLNNEPVMSPMELADRGIISIGETVMLFVALCGPDFDWLSGEDDPATGTDT